MSSNNSEQAVVTAKANVMIYDDSSKKWNPSGSGPGLAKVQIYQHLLNQTYRVVGRKVQDHEVVINCLLAKGLKYNQANQTFLQWRDSKQVYGLNFQSKDEADTFTQTFKMAVDNLNRLNGLNNNTTTTSNLVKNSSNIELSINNNKNKAQNLKLAVGALETSVSATDLVNDIDGNNMTADNISIGKRSISSDYNPIYDENDRQYNMVHGNNGGGIVGHHNNSNGNIYNGNTNGNNGINMRIKQEMQHIQQSVTSPPLSASSSTSSSSSSASNGGGGGLSIAITNGGGNNTNNTNGYNHHRQSSDNYNYNGHLTQQQQHQQQPLYQSSPIPPPPPPPPVPLFSNGYHHDNYSQKIYDVIPDSNFNTSSQPAVQQQQPPPPPPLPTGLFGGGAAPPPPPPPPPMNLSGGSSQQPANNSYMNEIAKFQQNKLKKVDESPASRQAQPPQLDFLTEIRQKIEKKAAMQQNGVDQTTTSSSSDQIDASAYKPSSNLAASQRKQGSQYGALKSANTSNNTNNNSINNNSNNSNQFESPKTIKKITSTPNVVNSNGATTNGYTNGNNNGMCENGAGGAYNLDKLKQELMNEFRKELQTFKAEIVTTILNELRRQNN